MPLPHESVKVNLEALLSAMLDRAFRGELYADWLG